MKVTTKTVKPTYKIELTYDEARLLMILFGGLSSEDIKNSLGNTISTMMEFDIHDLTKGMYGALHNPIEEEGVN